MISTSDEKHGSCDQWLNASLKPGCDLVTVTESAAPPRCMRAGAQGMPVR